MKPNWESNIKLAPNLWQKYISVGFAGICTVLQGSCPPSFNWISALCFYTATKQRLEIVRPVVFVCEEFCSSDVDRTRSGVRTILVPYKYHASHHRALHGAYIGAADIEQDGWSAAPSDTTNWVILRPRLRPLEFSSTSVRSSVEMSSSYCLLLIQTGQRLEWLMRQQPCLGHTKPEQCRVAAPANGSIKRKRLRGKSESCYFPRKKSICFNRSSMGNRGSSNSHSSSISWRCIVVTPSPSPTWI